MDQVQEQFHSLMKFLLAPESPCTEYCSPGRFFQLLLLPELFEKEQRAWSYMLNFVK